MKTKQGRQTFLAALSILLLIGSLIYVSGVNLVETLGIIILCLVVGGLAMLGIIWADRGVD